MAKTKAVDLGAFNTLPLPADVIELFDRSGNTTTIKLANAMRRILCWSRGDGSVGSV